MKSRTRRIFGFRLYSLCCVAGLSVAATARAANGVWLKTAAAGNWSDTANWVGGTAASGAGFSASFTNNAWVTVNQNVPGLTLGGLFFATGTYAVTNGAVTLDNGASPAVATVGIREAEATRATLTVPLNGTGGLTKLGPGHLDLTATTPGGLDGPLTVKAGTLTATATNGAPFGTGRILLTGGALEAMPAGGGLDVELALASGHATNTFAYGAGASTFRFTKGANTSLTLTLGNAGAGDGSVLARADNGVLIVAPTNGISSANLGATERLLVNGGVPTHNGMADASIAGRDNDTTDSGGFLTYNGTNGVVAANYTNGLGGGADSLADITSDTATSSAQVYALRVSGKTLTVNSGQTLTVGDGTRPAGVILNSTTSTPAVVTGGALNFGSSEGIIYFNRMCVGSALRGTISSTLNGSGGMTFAGLSPYTDMKLLPPAGGNPYTGGTRILSGRVLVTLNNSFGGGDIMVSGHGGWGGQLVIGTAITLTNTLHLASLRGYPESNMNSSMFGAIRIMGIGSTGTVLSGPLELLDTSCISVTDDSQILATLSGPIYGPGGLEIGGGIKFTHGTVLISGTNNTHTGGTRINAGKVRITANGALGSGPVENYSVLSFENPATLTLTNALSGTGTLIHQGAGTLKVSNAPNYAGPLSLGGTLDLCGASAAFGALSGAGRVVNPSGPAAVLTIGSANTNTLFAGTVEDGIALTKTGTGSLTLLGYNSYSGATTVSGGTLKLGTSVADISGLSYRLDATDADSLTLSGTNVTAWADADGRAVTFTQTTTSRQPLYVPGAINGLPAIRFGDASTYRKLVADKSTTAQTVFIVYRMSAHVYGDGIWGTNGGDVGIRAYSVTTWYHWLNNGDFTYMGKMYIDGTESTPGSPSSSPFTAYQPHILTAVSSNSTSYIIGLGHYFGSAGARYYSGEIGEVLAFDRTLSQGERQSVENYLSKKWRGVYAHPVVDEILPAATALCVSNNAAVDLNGVNQTVASLSGAGTVRNSNTDACTLTVGGDNASSLFYGGLYGNLSVVKTGSGTLTLYGTNTYSGTTTVQNGTLKLGVWTLPASGLSYRLDATDAATVTRSGSNVTAWADANGSALTFSQTDPALQPVYVTNAINGFPAVRFNEETRNRMAANIATNAQTVFILYKMNRYVSADYIWGQSGFDNGIRAKSLTEWHKALDAYDFTYTGQMFIDGVETSTFTAYQPHIVTATRASPVTWVTAIGDFWNSMYVRSFRGDIGEVLVYDRQLSTEERLSVEAWLTHKWFGAGVAGGFPENSSVTVATNATLDLNGQAQTLASLSGNGSVVNGTVTVSGETSPGGDGTVGTLALPDAPALSGTLLIDVRADGTCDQLVADGDLDVSQLALVIADTGQLSTASVYTIATCTGALSGSFTSHNLPQKSWAVRYIRTPGAGKILLAPRNGLVFSLR